MPRNRGLKLFRTAPEEKKLYWRDGPLGKILCVSEGLAMLF